MKSDLLKQTEIFIFLALVFSIFVAMMSEANKDLVASNQNHINQIDSLFKQGGNSDEAFKDLIKKFKELELERDSALSLIQDLTSDDLFLVIQDAHNKSYFGSGSAKVTRRLQKHIERKVIPQLISNVNKYPNFNCITVIGHTDHVRKYSPNKRFDNDLVKAYTAKMKLDNVKCNSNTDLGLLRAYSVVLLLKESEFLRKRIKYWHPYSAGAFIDEDDGQISRRINNKDDPRKRRIEIQLLKR